MHTILNGLIHFRYIGVFFVFMLEMIGGPFPAETTLTLCGVLWVRGIFSFWPLWAAAALGNMAGSTISYWLGCRIGMPLLARFGRYVWLTPARLERAQSFFERRRQYVLVIGKFISGIRLLAPFFAGINQMPFWSFTLINGLTAMVWAAVYIFEGRFFSELWRQFHAWMGAAGPILLVLVFVLPTVLRRFRRHR